MTKLKRKNTKKSQPISREELSRLKSLFEVYVITCRLTHQLIKEYENTGVFNEKKAFALKGLVNMGGLLDTAIHKNFDDEDLEVLIAAIKLTRDSDGEA